jgi:Flp pilus assembly protein TadG
MRSNDNSKPRRKDDKGTRGSVAVEAAFSMPVLLMSLFGVLEFSQAFLVRQNLVLAASEAARAATQATCPKPTESEIEEYTKSTLASLGLSPSLATIDLDNTGGASGTDMVVNLDYQIEMPVLTSLFGIKPGSEGSGSISVHVEAENE